MADAPEATVDTAQLPAPDLKQQAILLATEEFAQRPEADATEGTAQAPEPETTAEDTPPEPEPVDDRISRDELQRQLERQKASFKAELLAAQQVQERQSLLQQLDQLREEDPEAFASKLNEDPMAAAALAERASMIAPEVISRAKTEVVMDQARMLFEAIPEMQAIAEAQGEEWQKATNPETGGIFAYIKNMAHEQGKQQGVEDFKKSSEFKKALEEAERRGAHNALGGIGSPPPQEEGGVVGAPEPKFSDPMKQAVALANRQFGRQIVDPSGVGRRRVA